MNNHINFYPRSPCGERRRASRQQPAGEKISIHALLAESDALFALLCNLLHHYFYPRSPCGERQSSIEEVSKYVVISIHALLAESDKKAPCKALEAPAFLSTLSLRRATCHISTLGGVCWHFYPRSPCGERRGPQKTIIPSGSFLSTLSLRRATARRALGFVDPDISIHALLAESDWLDAEY